MKKLMIAAAIVCVAVAGQAAQVTWGSDTSSYVNSSGTKQKVMPTGQSIVLAVIGDVDGFAAGDWDGTVTKELATATLKTPNTTKGRVSENFLFDFSDKILKDNDVLAVVIKNGSKYEQIAYYNTANGMVTDTLKVAGLADDEDSWSKTLTFATKGNFTTAAAPEPTSAMLLLLGVAGLALKRRRA